ncbi:MAG: Cof-type HAD-IIB family hydrolase [Synergistaceae bacterium]|jgi:Cof subfamily protein (haloacid dehalogenase superfamily)|nr:Cof-type HAD-IIB family hydrolase [Synergistaceae bacterium]
MPQVKLIATDLDGTLLDSTGRIPERNLRALREAMARGVAATICTGRMLRSARQFAEQIGINIPLVCYNGAMLAQPDGHPAWSLTLDMGLAKELLAMCLERRVHVQSYVGDDLYVRDADAAVFRDYVKYFGVSGSVVGDDIFNPPASPTKLLAMAETEEGAIALEGDLKERFGDAIYVTRSLGTFVEMLNPEVNKANALRRLADDLGVAMNDVMAIGDGENDIEMIKSAGVGVAMENGADKIKSVADCIAPTNDENGVAWAIERYALDVGP